MPPTAFGFGFGLPEYGNTGGSGGSGPAGDAILQEDEFFILQEDGISFIEQE